MELRDKIARALGAGLADHERPVFAGRQLAQSQAEAIADAVLVAIASDLETIRALAQVEALREVADELNRLANTKSLIEAADKYAGHYAGVRAARQEAERLTRGSADRIAREAGIETGEENDD